MNVLPLLLSITGAVIPTLLYVLVFYWADRYEREPTRLLMVAFFWGAVPAVIVSLLGEVLLEGPFPVGRAESQALLNNVLVAPIVEETAKWLALLAIYLFRREEFDGPLDGLVYGALIGFGFAMTENIIFFFGAYSQGGYAAFSATFLLRALVFGMSHALYTALAGIALGVARNTTGAWPRTLWILAGWLLAVTAHSLHNLGAALTVAGGQGLALSLTASAASFLLVFLTVVWSWQHERAIIRTQLADEVGTAVTAAEYSALTRRWRGPVRPQQVDRRSGQDRHQLGVELALRKDRLTRAGASQPTLAGEVHMLRSRLVAGMSSVATVPAGLSQRS